MTRRPDGALENDVMRVLWDADEALSNGGPTNPPTVARFSGLGVAARMAALLEPPVPSPHRAQLLVLWSSLVVTAAFSAYQLHHLEQLFTALCPH